MLFQPKISKMSEHALPSVHFYARKQIMSLETEEEMKHKKSSRRVEDAQAEISKEKDDSKMMMENSRGMEDENYRRKESYRGLARTKSQPGCPQQAIWTEVRQDKTTLDKQCNWKELSAAEKRKLEKDGKTRREEIEKKKRRKYGKAGRCKLTEMEEAIMAGLARRLNEIAEIEKNLNLHKKRPKGWKVDQAKQGTIVPSANVQEGRTTRKTYEIELDGKENIEVILRILEGNIEILKKEEEMKTARGMEDRSQDDQKELLGKVEDIEIFEKVVKETNPRKISRGDDKSNTIVKNDVRGLMKYADMKKKKLVKVVKEDIGNFDDVDRKSQTEDDYAFYESDVDRNICKESFNESYEYDMTPTTAKLYHRKDKKRDEDNGRKDEETGRRSLEERRRWFGKKEEEEENVRLPPTIKPGIKPQQLKIIRNTAEIVNTKKMRCAVIEPIFAAKPDLYKMPGQGGSPIRGGGGRVMKPKRGTPSKLNFRKKIQIFENRASQGLTRGYFELLSQSGLGLNPTNLTAGGVGGGEVLNSEICVDQPEGGTQTRPRGACGQDISTGPGLVERCEGGIEPPMRCAGTELCTEEGGLRDEMHHAWEAGATVTHD